MIAFITQRLDYPLAAPAEQWEDRDFCLTAITLKRHALRLVPRSFWRESGFCLAAVKRTPEALEWADEKIITPELCLAAVQANSMALGYVPRLLLTKEMVQTAVVNNRRALAFVSDEWREEAKAALV
jgi:hypothetical protein